MTAVWSFWNAQNRIIYNLVKYSGDGTKLLKSRVWGVFIWVPECGLPTALFSESFHFCTLCAHSLWAPAPPIKAYTCSGQTSIPSIATFNTLHSSEELLWPENQQTWQLPPGVWIAKTKVTFCRNEFIFPFLGLLGHSLWAWINMFTNVALGGTVSFPSQMISDW